MVRLKADYFDIKENEMNMSQSHYGSIKSSMIGLADNCKLKSQSHYGSIKRFSKSTNHKPKPPVSIPLWFD